MPIDIELVRDSFALAATREPALTERFYQGLFTRAPELAPMFRRDPRVQAEMLRAALVAVVEHLEDAPWLTATASALGAKHRGYGVTAGMYGPVGAALIDALATACGDTWTPAHAAAWGAAYGALTDLMLAGAAGEAA